MENRNMQTECFLNEHILLIVYGRSTGIDEFKKRTKSKTKEKRNTRYVVRDIQRILLKVDF